MHMWIVQVNISCTWNNILFMLISVYMYLDGLLTRWSHFSFFFPYKWSIAFDFLIQHFSCEKCKGMHFWYFMIYKLITKNKWFIGQYTQYSRLKTHRLADLWGQHTASQSNVENGLLKWCVGKGHSVTLVRPILEFIWKYFKSSSPCFNGV